MQNPWVQQIMRAMYLFSGSSALLTQLGSSFGLAEAFDLFCLGLVSFQREEYLHFNYLSRCVCKYLRLAHVSECLYRIGEK